MNSATQKSEQRVRGAPDCPVCHQTVRCRKRTKAPMVTCSGTQTNSSCGDAPDSAQYLSGAPIASSLGQRLPRWLGAINTPNHHNLWHPSFLKITFNTRALAFIPRHNTKEQIPAKSQIHSKHLVACEREIFVFICALVTWIAFLLFPLLFSSAL
jgi:hypothetical protein